MNDYDEKGPLAWIRLMCMVVIKGVFVVVFIGVQWMVHYCSTLLPTDNLLNQLEILGIEILIAIGTFYILIKLLFKKSRRNPPHVPWYR